MLKKLFSVAFALGLVAPAFMNAKDEDMPTKDIVETAVAGKFNTLVAAVKAAELVETLKGKGPFTVFAPTDAAFKKIPKDALDAVLADKEKLTKILMLHVVKDKALLAKDVVGLDGKEVSGYTIKVSDGKVYFVRGDEKIQVTKTDIKCKNGVIHVIDTVLMPAAK